MKRDDYCACDNRECCPFKSNRQQLTPVHGANAILQSDGRVMRCRLKPHQPKKNRPTVFAANMARHKESLQKDYKLINAIKSAIYDYNK